MIMVSTNLAACCTHVPFILSLNTEAFSCNPEVASSICDNLAMLGGQEKTGVINLVSKDPKRVRGSLNVDGKIITNLGSITGRVWKGILSNVFGNLAFNLTERWMFRTQYFIASRLQKVFIYFNKSHCVYFMFLNTFLSQVVHRFHQTIKKVHGTKKS